LFRLESGSGESARKSRYFSWRCSAASTSMTCRAGPTVFRLQSSTNEKTAPIHDVTSMLSQGYILTTIGRLLNQLFTTEFHQWAYMLVSAVLKFLQNKLSKMRLIWLMSVHSSNHRWALLIQNLTI
jgi:hypothetical protein